jgi:hypothetical protein
MEEMMKVLKQKSHILYDMNSIEKYIKGGDCDQSLQAAWNDYKAQLDMIEEELRFLSNPETKTLEEHRLQLMDEIEHHQREIHMKERQIQEIDKKLANTVLHI